MTRAAARTVGLTLAALATAAALSGCEPQATPAQIRSEARSQSTLSTGPTGPTETGQGTPAARGTPRRFLDRRLGGGGAGRSNGGLLRAGIEVQGVAGAVGALGEPGCGPKAKRARDPAPAHDPEVCRHCRPPTSPRRPRHLAPGR